MDKNEVITVGFLCRKIDRIGRIRKGGDMIQDQGLL